MLQSHGSARVAEVDLHEANEIYELRLILEPTALERAVAAGDAGYRERVTAAWNALDAERIAPASVHAAFHRELLSACDSAWLLRLATMLSDRAGLMVTVGLPDRPAGYNTAAAHRTLADLALAGDATALRRSSAGTCPRRVPHSTWCSPARLAPKPTDRPGQVRSAPVPWYSTRSMVASSLRPSTTCAPTAAESRRTVSAPGTPSSVARTR